MTLPGQNPGPTPPGPPYNNTFDNTSPAPAPGAPGEAFAGGSQGSPGSPLGTPPGTPPHTPAPKRRNTVGIIALVCAVVGFVFACVPGALIVGWVLLPVSFILGLVALFRRGETLWQAISAVVLSIVGTIVGAVVFLGLAANSLDEALDGGSVTISSPGSDSRTASGTTSDSDSDAGPDPQGSSAADQAGTRENPLPLGTEISNGEWKIVVNSVTLDATDAVMAENPFNDAPPEGHEYVLVNYTVTYLGDDPNGAMPMSTVDYVSPDGTTMSSADTLAVAPDAIDTLATLYNGGSVTGNETIAVPSDSAQDGVLAVQPGMLDDKVFVALG